MDIENLEVQQTLPAISCDYDNLKRWAHSITDKYNGLLVTDDQIQAIKKDMAELNKAKDKLNRARIDAVKAVSAPIKEFEERIKEVVSLFDTAYVHLSEQVKSFEEAEKDKKRKEVEKLIDEKIAITLIEYPQMKDLIGVSVNPRWLNKTATIKNVGEEIDRAIQEQANANLEIERREKAQAERRLLIENAVKSAKEKYGLASPVSRFMTPEYVNLEVDAEKVLARLEREFEKIARERNASIWAENSRQAEMERQEREKGSPEVEQGFIENKPENPVSGPLEDTIIFRLVVEYPPEKEVEVREILNKNQFMRIVRQLQGIGVEVVFGKME